MCDSAPKIPFHAHFYEWNRQWQTPPVIKNPIMNQPIVRIVKKYFVGMKKSLYFCNRFSRVKSANNDLLAQLV